MVANGDAGRAPGTAKFDFFVSHAGSDRAWAEWVAWQLEDAGYTVELDAWSWAAGDNFVAKMHEAVDAADRVVALWSPAYFEDGRYTIAEWTSALLNSDGGGRHRLVPVQIEPCAVPQLLRPVLRVELFDVDQAEAVRRLREAVDGPRRPDGAPLFPGRGKTGGETSRKTGASRGRGEVGPRLPGTLPAVWNIGPRNLGFVGRDAVLARMRERLCSGGSAVVQALHGMSGIGKTQLAIEYGYGMPRRTTWRGGSTPKRMISSASSTPRSPPSSTWPRRTPTRLPRSTRSMPTCGATADGC
jgi:hypothetical protein